MKTLAWMLVLLALQGVPPLRVLEKGDQSNVDEARQVTVRTAAEWKTLWRQHSPDRDQPRVDFGRDMVVGVFLGSRTTAGFSVEIVSALVEQGVLVVRFRETRPQSGRILAQVITSPYHLVAVPRHSGEVRFENL
jgi:protease stability complex PrcB-like protein